ncbi:uncharacterized protein LOC124157511 [Ischnura elegans]|uniref:uncharacterized protein LOC124157511 n=1 Tax=Ischnura elegans TaxID=197161 RepID=UPI001ED895BB|nr:uncharacterized protein LOC124157511 [Ischnura elegans]XP_046388266.1 uncharacterized protein LOC124157511 [Ischnura elegans]
MATALGWILSGETNAVLPHNSAVFTIQQDDHEIHTALAKQKDVINLCMVGGFSLRKWHSNSSTLLQWLPQELLANEPESLFANESIFAVLGLNWQPSEDCFNFNAKIDQKVEQWTKRLVLSKVAKLFDPLGWIAPVIITAKIFLQKLWLLKIDWDEPLPRTEAEQWETCYSDLPQITNIKVPRRLGYSATMNVIELHGFADASKSAYGAVLYLRTSDKSSEKSFRVRMIQAKTRVAPLRTISIPRLELSAAHLLPKLTNHHTKRFESELLKIHLWTDSQDVLCWLKEHPSRWPTFIANRCSDIHTLVPTANWRHIGTKNNPADLASRGCLASALKNQNLWWSGPDWLSKCDQLWPKTVFNRRTNEQSKIPIVLSTNTATIKASGFNIFQKYSNLKTTVHVMAYVIRFLQAKKLWHPIFSASWFNVELMNADVILNPSEVIRARLLLVYIAQRQSFSKEISILEKNEIIPKNSVLIRLTPFIDQKLLKVGGRLKHSLLSEDEKHPLIIPSDHPLTRLIIEDCHKRTLHGGVQLTLTTLRTQYWVLKGRQKIKEIIHKCVVCQRYRKGTSYQIMGNLPQYRTMPNRPFSKSGVDYAGPVSIKTSPGKCRSSYKGFICVFVCLSTRAVHLEAVSNYTSEAFIAAFRRFVGRRGHCSLLLSDKGTNFVGADRELKELFQRSSNFTRTLAEALASNGTEWRFNPPTAPHFGGIWEAAVKSTKHHLRRVIGETKLTFEELSTLLCQVEACLNSRPLVPLSDDPNDIQALTPAHFLIQSSSYLIPEPALIEENIPTLKRWQMVQQMLQHYWRRWSREYLQSLQQRQKWATSTPNIKAGDLVIACNDNTPPARWQLARVIKVHPGDDGYVRVVTIQTANSVLKRPVNNLIILK